MAQGASGPESGAGANGDRRRVEQVVRRCRAGSAGQDDYTFLFERFGSQLERQFIRWGSSVEEARDLNQETFQRIFQGVESFQGTGDRLFESWVSWIWTIARTTLRRSVRFQRAQKRPQNVQSLDALEDSARNVARLRPPQQEEVEEGEAVRQVREAVDELPEQERKCVILFYYQEKKIRQIAVILRLAEGTVKAHLNHARAKLKVGLQDRFDFEGDTDDRA
ncbi:MAG: sigma-70 family RNA polymerase sigma factor [bacterium]|nr:sigma-70 family RNA polymerase sigma factor [bacterium]